MSHFLVIVVGDQPEEQLAPFAENLKVEAYPRYLDDVDRRQMANYYNIDFNDKAALVEKMKVWTGGEGRISKDGRLYSISTYNPKSKWDWYQLGGRWVGYFKLKEGAEGELGMPSPLLEEEEFDSRGRADAARKGAIDFEGMMAAAAEKAAGEYDQYVQMTAGFDPPAETWPQVRDRIAGPARKAVEKAEEMYAEGNLSEEGFGEFRNAHLDALDEARTKFNSHEWVRALAPLALFRTDLHDYFCVGAEDPRMAFIERARDSAVTAFAVLKDGKWFERGQMGWWGRVSDEKDQKDWNREFRKLLTSLPDDTLLSAFDCHI